ncbi:VOC family protein [Photobacterium chitinilyticum]|uniref:VOC family protein n=1 Tax=Photobacterium chitinilyticum TaxID=2485123 RepID=A0A3S3S013_9GAMM|nr:VOC family protein [Photobacterium chitinilyticum]RWX54635.1 VOC family protein [Photobacterium chitinilyticum]
MSNLFKQHGAFSWSELVTDDPEKAIAFYTDVIGWEVEAMQMQEGVYYVLKTGGEPVGGIMAKPQEFSKMPNYWGTYITVDDVDAILAQAELSGGKAVYPPMDVPGVGRMCAISDPGGAIVSVITYEENDCE